MSITGSPKKEGGRLGLAGLAKLKTKAHAAKQRTHDALEDGHSHYREQLTAHDFQATLQANNAFSAFEVTRLMTEVGKRWLPCRRRNVAAC